MRLLVAIANHGTKNRKYLDRLIAEYRKFSFDVDIVVLSNIPKDLDPDIEVRVGAPIENPWSLPFGHRKLFVERQDDYDLFVYSEDDTELTEAHVTAFLETTDHLPADHIAGFVRHEIAPDGTHFYSTVHGPYHWDPASIVEAGGKIYARYTNDHAACYVLTRQQLKACIASGGFDIAPHEGRYDMLCSASTDPYTRCGFTKVVCVSEIGRYSLRHLPDIYLGRIGVLAEEVELQVARLLEIAGRDLPLGPLVRPDTDLPLIAFDKSYFEPLRPELVELVTGAGRAILSVGCDQGVTEGALAAAGHEVLAIPLDPVIAASAQARGVITLPADLDTALGEIGERRFDYVLLNNLLAHVADPPAMLRRLAPHLKHGGRLLAGFINAGALPALRKLARGVGWRAALAARSDFNASHYHFCTGAMMRGWLRAAGFGAERTVYRVPDHHAARVRRSLGLARAQLADSGVVIATPPAMHPDGPGAR